MKMVRIITPADIQQRDNISMSKQTNERWQIWCCWPCIRCSESWVPDMRRKANFLPIVKISAEFCWIQNVLYACTRMSGLRLRKPELPNFQGCQTVFEINVKERFQCFPSNSRFCILCRTINQHFRPTILPWSCFCNIHLFSVSFLCYLLLHDTI